MGYSSFRRFPSQVPAEALILAAVETRGLRAPFLLRIQLSRYLPNVQ